VYFNVVSERLVELEKQLTGPDDTSARRWHLISFYCLIWHDVRHWFVADRRRVRWLTWFRRWLSLLIPSAGLKHAWRIAVSWIRQSWLTIVIHPYSDQPLNLICISTASTFWPFELLESEKILDFNGSKITNTTKNKITVKIGLPEIPQTHKFRLFGSAAIYRTSYAVRSAFLVTVT